MLIPSEVSVCTSQKKNRRGKLSLSKESASVYLSFGILNVVLMSGYTLYLVGDHDDGLIS